MHPFLSPRLGAYGHGAFARLFVYFIHPVELIDRKRAVVIAERMADSFPLVVIPVVAGVCGF